MHSDIRTNWGVEDFSSISDSNTTIFHRQTCIYIDNTQHTLKHTHTHTQFTFNDTTKHTLTLINDSHTQRHMHKHTFIHITFTHIDIGKFIIPTQNIQTHTTHDKMNGPFVKVSHF